MVEPDHAALHDAYAGAYDAQIKAYDCHIAELLFGLCYEFVGPGQRLLDAGIGSGLSSELFAKAGLEVHGMDFAPAMLQICQAKGFAVELKRHDLEQVPWPYDTGAFDLVVCCGVLHFVAELDEIFDEAGRVLASGGVFAFTTRAPSAAAEDEPAWETQLVGEFSIYSHGPRLVDELLARHGFGRRKRQWCHVGDDVFCLWVAGRSSD